ncbi:hypothetical protein OTB20_25895 [Streptomyces sp. H27-H1]|uniref:hypothetical protein n=1 Tax=Streptomyces sp. H27-H1 TaxID=2996461 RepID=UPI002271F15F|nr:hypothetical protein [Streptomyces sp. H27-H1]MCY0929568.1 hypothetical protein [Streptomyces sp. H27-H1]
MPTLPLRTILVDRAHALVPLDPAGTRAGAVVLRLPGAVVALTAPGRSGRRRCPWAATGRATRAPA